VNGPRTVQENLPRVLGRYSSGDPGPTLIVTAGLHGNEPAGVCAAQRVMERLEEEKPPLRGELIAVAGNIAALAKGARYIDHDLNRCWSPANVQDLRARDPAEDTSEDKEQRALLEIIDRNGNNGTRLVVLDLHTTSGETPPFALMSDTLRNRRLAFSLPLPVVLGLEEEVRGTLLDYLAEEGHRGLVVEAGQHDDPDSTELHEGALWLILAAGGVLRQEDIPDRRRWVKAMREAVAGLPRVLEVRYRHRLRRDDNFAMRPGWRGFQVVEEGAELARDRSGTVTSPQRGRLLMPLYQKQGTDGFFIVRSVNRAWLWVSAALRKMKLHVLLPLMPGVSRHPDWPGAIRVNPKVARYFPVEIFHLFGFRRRRPASGYLIFTRRR
jgi:succinylglutamate desuccinylase